MRSFLILATVLMATIDASGAATAAHPSLTRLVVLDIELTGDLGGPELENEHSARVQMASAHLRAELERAHIYEVVDNTPEQALIDSLGSVQHLYKCNGCELDIARRLGAGQVLVAWIHRVSNLILTLNYEIRDVDSGETRFRSSFNFRGDNNAAWTRAVEYLVRDLQERVRARE